MKRKRRWAANVDNMLIREFDSAKNDSGKLAALAQLLSNRADDTNAQKTIGIKSFLSLAKNLGVNLSPAQLRNLVQQPPLNNFIQNVDGDDTTGQVVFKGAEQAPTTMPVDQAQKTVDQMAKRAAAKAA